MTATTTSPTATRLLLTTPNMSTTQLEQILDFDLNVPYGDTNHGNTLGNYIHGGLNRSYPQSWGLSIGAAYATDTITFSSTGPANSQTITIAGVTFTAKTSGATGNQFNISATPATVAANLTAAINASTNLVGLLTATSALGVVTVKSAVPGAIGNFITVANVNLANTAVATATLTGGVEGDAFSINML
jgi:hypothetical protein